MGYITVKRKGYRRKDGTWVKATTYKVKDKGAKGRTPASKHWFDPKVKTGWRKSQTSATRRRKLLDATDKRRSMRDRYIEAGRMAQALANVTTDGPTKTKATSDAQHFFKKARGIK